MKKATINDEYWMTVALILAVEGIGLTRPNPPVGAVVVKNKRIVGMGFHPKAGQPHAEIYALKEAGTRARGATIYVTLEPCCTTGRTPPCTDAIIQSGVKRVVYGCVDPNPDHAGKADKILRKAGIDVMRNVLPDECGELITPFKMRFLQRRPFVTLKLACSLDGRIADARGESKWITGKAARNAVHQLRRTADGIMVGAETVRKDNPTLLPKPAHGRQPLRIVLAGKSRLPANARVFTDRHASRTVVFISPGHAVLKQKKALERNGAQLIVIPSRKGAVSIPAAMRKLSDMNCMHIVCEGGGAVASSLLKDKLADRLFMFYAPIVLGGRAKPAVGGIGWTLNEAPEFEIQRTETMEQDILVVAVPQLK